MSDNNDYLAISGEAMYLYGTTTLADPKHNAWNHKCNGHLTINTDVKQQSGAMNVEADESIEDQEVRIEVNAELVVSAGATLSAQDFNLLGNTNIMTDGTLNSDGSVDNSGKLNIEQNGSIQATYLSTNNTSNIETNGIIDVNRLINYGDFHILTHSNTTA